MLAFRTRGNTCLVPVVLLPTLIYSLCSTSAAVKGHDETDVCTSDVKGFAEQHSITPDMALLQKAAIPSSAPSLLEESVESAKSATAANKPANKYKRVPLNEKGYKYVLDLKDDKEMQGFVRRLVDELGLEIVDEGGLSGMVPYYSGKKAKQSFSALQSELGKVPKKRKPWAVPPGKKADRQRSTDLHSTQGKEKYEEEVDDEYGEEMEEDDEEGLEDDMVADAVDADVEEEEEEEEEEYEKPTARSRHH